MISNTLVGYKPALRLLRCDGLLTISCPSISTSPRDGGSVAYLSMVWRRTCWQNSAPVFIYIRANYINDLLYASLKSVVDVFEVLTFRQIRFGDCLGLVSQYTQIGNQLENKAGCD